MKIRLHIMSSLSVLLTLGFFQACGIDPLDATTSGPSTNPSDATYSVCEDPTLPDTDGDGMNDKCEALITPPGEPNNPDCNSNGIPDGMEPNLGPNCTTLPEDPPCPPADSTLTCDEYKKEQEGQKNKELNKISDGALLANSGLNATAPNGTKVEIQKQFIRIVFNQVASPNNSGLQGADILEVCENAPSFIYYRIEGNIAYATGHDGAVFGPSEHAVMELCAPLTSLMSNNPGVPFVQSSFKWKKGWIQGSKYTGFFVPPVATDSSQKLTLTPSVEQNYVWTKMDVKFEHTFKVQGKLYTQYGTTVNVSTPETVVTLRKFKRAAEDEPFTVSTTPHIVGPWRATN